MWIGRGTRRSSYPISKEPAANAIDFCKSHVDFYKWPAAHTIGYRRYRSIDRHLQITLQKSRRLLHY